MKIGRYLIAFLMVMALLITFGNRGLVDSYFMSKKLSELKSLNKENAAENKKLKKSLTKNKVIHKSIARLLKIKEN